LRRLEEREGWADLERVVLALLDDGLLPAEMKVHRVDSDGLWVDHQGWFFRWISSATDIAQLPPWYSI
jgi:hypothetical protein